MKVEIMTKNQVKKYIRKEMDSREKRYMNLLDKLWKKIVALETRLDMKVNKIKIPGGNEK